MTATVRGNGDRVWLEGVDHYRVVDPMFECVRVVLTYRGEAYSPAYVQGISGAAFRIGGICPCGPTDDCAMSTQELVRLFGYEAMHLPLYQDDGRGEGAFDMEAEADNVIARVKAEIRAGRPAIVWHAFTTAEWDVVAGFDAERGLFLGQGSYAGMDGYAEADARRLMTCVDICPAEGAILVRDRVATFDPRAAEVAALREAVRHARDTTGQDRLGGDVCVVLHGQLCYDRWIEDWRDPDKTRSMGDAYCLGVYRSRRRAAVGFAQGLAQTYPEAAEHLEASALHFTDEADALDACVPLFSWGAPEGPDPERNAKVVPLLQAARDAYARGIDEVEAAVTVIAGEV